MRYAVALFLLFTATACVHAQDKAQRLLVAEYRLDSPQIAKYTYLVSYNFRNGVFFSKDTLVGSGTQENGETTLHLMQFGGKNLIYKNQYVITQFGGVHDLETNETLYRSHLRFVEAIGDTLVYYTNSTTAEKGYVSLDLKSREYARIDSNSWYQRRYARESPDGTRYLSLDRSKLPYKVCLHDKAGDKTVLVEDAGAGPHNPFGSQIPDVETYWLNNHSFFYVVHHRKQDKQNRPYHQVDIRKYDLENKSDEVFVTLDSVPRGGLNGSFLQNGIGQIIYRASSGTPYLLDTVGNRLLDYPEYQMGHGFSHFRVPEEGTTIKFHGNEIGTLWCLFPFVTDSAVAVKYGDVGSNLGYPKGIKIWTTQQNGWITFDLPWVNKIVGWVERE